VGLFNLFGSKKQLFNEEEKQRIVQAIRGAEKQTSGEVRVYIESRCRFVNPVDRAVEIFYGLKMQETDDRNAVLLYLAIKDRQLAVFGDEGIHQKLGAAYWNDRVAEILADFNREDYVTGIVHCVTSIGEALHTYFPYYSDDKNELPDDIVFGK
jgi:uncharacterized membrane protein